MKAKRIKSLALILVVGMLALTLSACGGGKDSAGSASSTAASYENGFAENMSAAGASAQQASGGDMAPYADEEWSADQAEAPSAEAEEELTPRVDNRKLIVTVQMEAETEEYDSFMAWLDERLAQAGGYIETSDQYAYSGSSRNSYLRLRVPAGQLNAFLSAVGENCNVLQRSVQQEDVTLSYVDTQSHRDALLVEQRRLLELLEKAESLEDIISLEDRLTNVRYQLQNYESSLRVYDNQINYSTIEFSLREVGELTQPEPETWGSRAWQGFVDNAKGIAIFFQELGLWIFTHLPTFAILAVIVLIVLICTAKQRREAKARRKAQKELVRAMREENGKKAE